MQIFTGNVSRETRSPCLSSREKIFRIFPFRVYLDKFASGIGLCVKRDPRESTKKSREGSEQTTFVYYTPSHQQYFLPLPQLFRGQWGAFWTLQSTLCVRLIGKNASSFMKDSLFLLIIPTHLIFSNTPERNIKNNLLFAVFFRAPLLAAAIKSETFRLHGSITMKEPRRNAGRNCLSKIGEFRSLRHYAEK